MKVFMPLSLKILTCLFFCLVLISPPHARAEWYVSMYGGLSNFGNFDNVEMPTLSSGLLLQRSPSLAFLNPNNNPTFSLSDRVDASDIKLQDSLMFGARAGHFFNNLGFPWLGVEVETYTTKPDVKSQNIRAIQTVTRFDNSGPGCPAAPVCPNDTSPTTFTFSNPQALTESQLRVTTLAVNIIARYPGERFQPYIGTGLGGFWFRGKNQFDGSKIVPGLNALAGLKVILTEHWGIFAEGKFNRATVDGLGHTLGVKANYSIFHWIAGVTFTFEGF